MQNHIYYTPATPENSTKHRKFCYFPYKLLKHITNNFHNIHKIQLIFLKYFVDYKYMHMADIIYGL